MGLTGDILYRIGGTAKGFTDAASQTEKGLTSVESKTKETKASVVDLNSAFGQLNNVMGAFAGTLATVGFAALLKDSAMVAARTQELGGILMLVGEQAGYMRRELALSEEKLKKLGITTQVARQSLIRMVQVDMNLTDAEKLAAAARDLATVAAKDTSETLDTLILGLVTLNGLTFRSAGASISLDQAYQEYAKTLGKTGRELTIQERRQAAFNAVIKFAGTMQGSYEEAMKSASKQLRSYARYTEEAKEATGEFLLPAMTGVVMAGGKLLQSYTKLDEGTRKFIVTCGLFVTALLGIVTAATTLRLLGPIFAAVKVALTSMSPELMILLALVAAVSAAWVTNWGNIRERTSALGTSVSRILGGMAATIVNVAKIIAAAFEFIGKAILNPFEVKKSWDEMEAKIKSASTEMADVWKIAAGDMTKSWKDAAKAIEESQRKSNLALRDGTLKLTDEQMKARDELRAYGVQVDAELVKKLASLNGDELRSFVIAKKQEVDAARSAAAGKIEEEKKVFEARERLAAAQLETEIINEEAALRARYSQRLITEEELNRGLLAVSQKKAEGEAQAIERELTMFKDLGKKLVANKKMSNDEYLAEVSGLEARIIQARARANLDRIQEEEKLRTSSLEKERAHLDQQIALEKEMGAATLRNVYQRRLFDIQIAYREEDMAHKRMLEDKKITGEEYERWREARQQQSSEEVKAVFHETAKYSEEWASETARVMAEAGAKQADIERVIMDKRRDSARSFTEGIAIAADQFLIDMQNWADVGEQVMSDFSSGATDIISDQFILAISGQMDTWRESTLRLTTSVLKQLIDQLVKMGIQWVILQITGKAATATTTAVLTIEDIRVKMLTASYITLAAAKKLAGMSYGGAIPGKQAGGPIPGYGGGDRHQILVEGGEFVNRKEAVSYYGPRLFDALNRMAVPKHEVQPYASRAQAGGAVLARSMPGQQEAGKLLVVNVMDEDRISDYFGSRKYGRVVVSRVSEDIMRRMGGER